MKIQVLILTGICISLDVVMGPDIPYPDSSCEAEHKKADQHPVLPKPPYGSSLLFDDLTADHTLPFTVAKINKLSPALTPHTIKLFHWSPPCIVV